MTEHKNTIDYLFEDMCEWRDRAETANDRLKQMTAHRDEWKNCCEKEHSLYTRACAHLACAQSYAPPRDKLEWEDE